MVLTVNGITYKIVDTILRGFIVVDENGDEKRLARDERGIWKVITGDEEE
jgi:hypothetical protein